jgi:DNA-binding transcriptional regulator YhcF (GntR family)
MTENYQIIDEGERKYFFQIPNMIDDAGLSPIALRLYCHLKRVAGSSQIGYCSQSIETMAEACDISSPTIVKAKAELRDAGFIKIHERRNKNGSLEGHLITITNVWNINEEIYNGVKNQNLDFENLCKKFGLSETSKDARIKNIYIGVKRICTRILKNVELKNTLKNNLLEDLASQPFAVAQPSLLDQEQPQEPKLKTEKPKTEKTLTANQVMVGILSKVTGLDYNLKTNLTRLAKQAGDLVRAGYAPEFVEREYSTGGWWYSNDWRGKKDQRPTPEQVAQTIGQIGPGTQQVVSTTPQAGGLYF